MNAKQRAAEAAISFVSNGMTIGLGTGSTADFFLIALSARLQSGQLRDVRGVPTSLACERRALELKIPVCTLCDSPQLDLTIDGADEVDPALNLIKGLGGALVREKIVAQASKSLIIVVDSSKRVPQLGTRSPLPVEVVPFSHEIQPAFFRALGADPQLRQVNGQTFYTDNGNVIYDCRFNGIPDARALERSLNDRAGIVGCGLFLNMARHVLIADGDQLEQLDR